VVVAKTPTPPTPVVEQTFNFDRKGVSDGKWTIYTKNGCPYCTQAIKLLTEKGLEFIQIDREELGIPAIDEICAKAGKPELKTWPRIIDPNGVCIGGNGDLHMKLTGALPKQ
jgi:glutaredoxin